MDTDSIEYLLLNYFNEVIWVKENPAFFDIIENCEKESIELVRYYIQ